MFFFQHIFVLCNFNKQWSRNNSFQKQVIQINYCQTIFFKNKFLIFILISGKVYHRDFQKSKFMFQKSKTLF